MKAGDAVVVRHGPLKGRRGFVTLAPVMNPGLVPVNLSTSAGTYQHVELAPLMLRKA